MPRPKQPKMIPVTQIKILQNLSNLDDVESTVNKFALANRIVIDSFNIDYLRKAYYVIIEYKIHIPDQAEPEYKTEPIIRNISSDIQKEKAPSNPQKEKKWYE